MGHRRRADVLPNGKSVQALADRLAPNPIVTPPVGTPPVEDPAPTTVSHSHNGFAGGTNPGQGGAHNNAPGGGSNTRAAPATAAPATAAAMGTATERAATAEPGLSSILGRDGQGSPEPLPQMRRAAAAALAKSRCSRPQGCHAS